MDCDGSYREIIIDADDETEGKKKIAQVRVFMDDYIVRITRDHTGKNVSLHIKKKGD